MPQNKNALIRYRTIDKCLQNNYRKWTLEDLIEACSETLYEYEGRNINVSKRTVQLDIQTMRSEKLGYNAPIEVYDKKYYRYADEDFTITDIPLTETDMNVLTETVEMLRQFKDFSLFAEVGDIIQRLEDKIYVEKTNKQPIIHLDKNEHLQGIHFLDTLYQSILKKIVLKIKYKSFKSREPKTHVFHPYLLKEYNNRWFLVGKHHAQSPLITLALDRILAIDYDLSIEYHEENIDANIYYKDVIGVTVDRVRTENVTFRVDRDNSPYVKTKPFHASQRVVEESENGTIFQIKVKPNLELERLILGFGSCIEVIAPQRLRRKIGNIFRAAAKMYEES